MWEGVWYGGVLESFLLIVVSIERVYERMRCYITDRSFSEEWMERVLITNITKLVGS